MKPTPIQHSLSVVGPMSASQVEQDDHSITVTGPGSVTYIEQQVVQAPPAKQTPANVSAPSGLPRAVPFIGRAKTLTDLMADLRAGSAVGIFALAGMGGVGKTALAAEAVALLAGEHQTFPAGAAWIGCEDLRGPEGVAEVWNRVARALDAAEVAVLPDAEAQRAALHALLAVGARRPLALDNVDALEAQPLLDTLAVQGHTTLLLTARATIDLPGLEALSLDTLPPDEAQRLFATTLRRSSPKQPRPTPEDEAALPGLVADLGGLPLALELTATCAGRQGLALATVREEIRRDGVEAAPFLPAHHPQQKALALRFDRSWLALAETPHRQRLFASLSLLAGDSFPRAAALALAKSAAEAQATEASAAVDLAALVDYALVETLPGERYRLHPLLRAYAGKRLEADTKAARDRLGEAMIAFWLAYARAHPDYDGIATLEAEAPGLLGALAWVHDHARHTDLLSLVNALRQAWHTRGRRVEELRIYTWAEEAADALKDLMWQRWAAHQRALTLANVGQMEEARMGYQRALDLARQMGSLKNELDEINALAVLAAQIGRPEEARAGYQRALELARQLGSLRDELDEVHSLAVLDFQAGRVEARAGYQRALDLARQVGDLAAEATELRNFGDFLCQQGEVVRGRPMIEQSLSISERLSDVYHIGKCHEFLARVERRAGNTAAAIVYYRQALARFEQVQSPDAKDVRAWLRSRGAEP